MGTSVSPCLQVEGVIRQIKSSINGKERPVCVAGAYTRSHFSST